MFNSSRSPPRKLCVEYLDPAVYLAPERFSAIQSFLDLVHGWNIGWHYAVDLSWIFERSRKWSPGARVLDAGGGRGPAQYLLLESGYDVTNIDLTANRPTFLERSRYRAKFEHLPSFVDTEYSRHLDAAGRWLRAPRRWAILLHRELVQRFRYSMTCAQRNRWRSSAGFRERPIGKLHTIRGNLKAVPELLDASFDAVVSLSAIEHIPSQSLGPALDELHRLVGPEGSWAVTTAGTERSASWFHDPSKGHCFSSHDLQRLFQASLLEGPSAARVLQAYKDCQFLKERLAPFYGKSGDNGMPWGIWSPAYVPVGLCDA